MLCFVSEQNMFLVPMELIWVDFPINLILIIDCIGWGTNEGLIVSILGHRNASQRKIIRETYAETYGEDLLKALNKELTSDFEVC